MVDFSQLPIELINIILNYTDIVVFRHGKYLNRIPNNDKRYEIITKRCLPIWFSPNLWCFYFKMNNSFYKRIIAIENMYDQNNNRHYLTEKEFIRDNNNYIVLKKSEGYIFNLKGECCKI